MTAVDFDKLQSEVGGVAASLLANRTVHEDTVTGPAATGFAAVAAVEIAVKVGRVRSDGEGHNLNVTIEGSPDGDVWTPVDGCDFDFTAGGTQRATVQSPPDQLRVVLTPTAVLSATLSSVRAIPHFVNIPAMSADRTAFLDVAKPTVASADVVSILAALVTLGLVIDGT